MLTCALDTLSKQTATSIFRDITLNQVRQFSNSGHRIECELIGPSVNDRFRTQFYDISLDVFLWYERFVNRTAFAFLQVLGCG